MTTLTEAKAYLRVDTIDEDDTIQSMMDAAQAAACDYLGLDALPDPLPAPIEAAILLAVGDLYENREAQADVQLFDNRTYTRLLAPYRVMGV